MLHIPPPSAADHSEEILDTIAECEQTREAAAQMPWCLFWRRIPSWSAQFRILLTLSAAGRGGGFISLMGF